MLENVGRLEMNTTEDNILGHMSSGIGDLTIGDLVGGFFVLVIGFLFVSYIIFFIFNHTLDYEKLGESKTKLLRNVIYILSAIISLLGTLYFLLS